MGTTSELLDSEELLHLAIDASNKGETEKAVVLLKRSLDIDPNDGKAMYMLGSLHAELGMYERAIEEIQKATELAPEIATAHFQLGLLYITSGNAKEAEEAWQALDDLDEKHYLRLFSDGMIQLAQNNFQEAVRLLQSGIMNNKENRPLNNDMLKMINMIEKGTTQLTAAMQKNSEKISQEKQEENENEADNSGARILSAYNNDFNS